jgi:hypothetical protein
LAGAGAVAAGLAGCAVLGGDEGTVVPDPLAPLLVGAVALARSYDEAIAAVPALADQLTPVRDAHRAHAKALADAIGATVPPAPLGPGEPPASRSAALSALRRLERDARDEAVAACLAAGVRTAPLLGSIAAARASHLEVLK